MHYFGQNHCFCTDSTLSYGVAFSLERMIFSLECSLFVLLDTQQGIFGHVPQVKETTTSSTAILLTRRFPSPSACRSGIRRCLTRLCLSASSMTTRSGAEGARQNRTFAALCSALCLNKNPLHSSSSIAKIRLFRNC